MKGFYQKIAFFLALLFSSQVLSRGSGVLRKLLDKSCMSEWLSLIVSVDLGDKMGLAAIRTWLKS